MATRRTRPRTGSGNAGDTAVVVLAAGASSRMGRSKPLVEMDGAPLLARVLETARAAGVGPTVLVLGDRAAEVRARLDLNGGIVVENPDYRRGMSTSLRAGVAAVPPGARRVAIVLADQPFVSPGTLRALAARASTGDGAIFVPTYRGVWGNPVMFDLSLSPELASLDGDVGCRGMFPRHGAEIREVPVDDPGILVDFDTPEEIQAVGSALAGGQDLRSVLDAAAAPRIALHADPRDHPVARRLRRGPDVDAVAASLRRDGVPFALATVVRAVRPTSGRPGYKAVIRADGSHVGWVGGACTEHLLISESLRALREQTPRLLRVAPEADESAAPAEGVVERPMVCQSGGTVEIFIEPNLPKPTVLVVGDSPVAASLATLAPVLGFRVVLAAPGAEPHDLPEVDAFVADLKDLPKHLEAGTYAVVASMGKYDEAALAPIARSPVAFVGLVASRKRARAVFAAVREDGVSEAQLARVRAPAGVDISASTPEEIALSVLAEIVRVRRTTASPDHEESVPAARTASVAIDPVCHMEVATTSPLTHVHAGTTYYFCSDGCRRQFARAPAKFGARSARKR